MYNIRGNEAKLDDLLNRIAEGLQLDETRRNKMETAYNAVSDWIEADEGFFAGVEFEIYPHGSVRTNTTVKPTGKEEFDLDFVIHIHLDWQKHNPFKVYNELKRRLQEHDTYKKMLEPKNRVLRLNYAGDFHMDIMPGCQEFAFDQNRIVVPDKKQHDWVSSNPRGYAGWFENEANSVREFLLEKAMSAEQLPDQEPYHLKKPLKRAVQLIKRYRDIYFEEDSDNATSSIILTTLAGQIYDAEGSIYDTVNNIVARMHKAAQRGVFGFKVFNPVNPNEEFTDKWRQEPVLFERFLDFVKDFKATWESIKKESGIRESQRELKLMFGENSFAKAFGEQEDFFAKAFGTPASGINIISSNRDEYEGLRRLAVKSKPYAR